MRAPPEEARVGSGLPQGQGLWVPQTWARQGPSWTRQPFTHHRAARTYTGLGKRLLEGTGRTLCATRTREKGAVTPQETDPDLPRSVQESPAEAACCRVRAAECSSASRDLLKEAAIIFITSTLVWPQGN